MPAFFTIIRRVEPKHLISLSARHYLAAFSAGLVLLLVLCLPLLAQQLPALTGRVVDNANIIDAITEQRLTEKLAAFEQKSSDQIVVATITDLGGDAIEPYANRLFRQWGLGQAQENNGILLLVAVDDRKMRIEVGYGLEGTLTDLHSRLIIENIMVPAFRQGDYATGIENAVDEIIGVLEGNGAELEARHERNNISNGDILNGFIVIFVVVWMLLFIGTIAFSILAPIFGRKIGPKRYKWLGMTIDFTNSGGGGRSSSSGGGGWSSGSSGGGFSGGGGSSGGGGASGSW